MLFEQINKELSIFLSSNPSDAALSDFLNNWKPQVKAEVNFNRIDPSTLIHPTAVWASLVVQDIRDGYYYYSYVGKRGDKEGCLRKWGHQQSISEDLLQNNDYIRVMTDREPVICMPTPFLTKWAAAYSQQINKFNEVELICDFRADFKLGDTIHILAVYQPQQKKLYFIRAATADQIKKENLDPIAEMAKQTIDNKSVKKELISFLSKFVSERYAYFLVYSMISDQPIFISCDANLTPLISLLLPRVNHLILKAPLHKSLFPYKNQESELIRTQMQSANLPTYTIIDFLQFSTKNEIKIDQAQIDNLKALKVFVEEGTTVYRWEIGQSHLSHFHSGLIVKGSGIITPQFLLKQEKTNLNPQDLSGITEQTLNYFRAYLQSVFPILPLLSQNDRQKIQVQLLQLLKNGSVKQQGIEKRMTLARLEAKSQGRNQITEADWSIAHKLMSD